jgi:hypothetical protein
MVLIFRVLPQLMAADIALGTGIVFIALYLGDPVVLHQYFQPAVLGAQHASCLMPLTHINTSLCKDRLLEYPQRLAAFGELCMMVPSQLLRVS